MQKQEDTRPCNHTYIHCLVTLLFLQADDLKYLGFATQEVPETVYLMFKEAKLLQSREALWEIRKDEVLALPSPSAERRHGLEWMRSELTTVFKKHIKPGAEIVFRDMRPGNEHVVRGFTIHFVIDSYIVCRLEEVHKRLKVLLGSDYECQEPCLCQRRLLNNSMIDALSRQKAGPSRDRIYQNIMAEYMLVSRPQINLAQVTSIPNSPAVSRPNSANASMAPVVGLFENALLSNAASHEGSLGSRPAASAHHVSGVNLAALTLSGGSSAVADRQQGSRSHGPSLGASAGRPPAVTVVQERETCAMPGVHDPLLFHNGIQAALASVLKHSAGQDCPAAFIRSCNHPSNGGAADTVTVRLCPNKSKSPLDSTNIKLLSCVVPGNEKQLYLPVSFDFSSWSQAKSDAMQHLYELLERLHELILPGVASVNLYYDADDGCIAFNRGNKLWYNAHADRAYDQSPQGVRLFNWYITVCHELAHNFRHEHDEVFSDYLAHIALQHSRAFYALCAHYHISM